MSNGIAVEKDTFGVAITMGLTKDESDRHDRMEMLRQQVRTNDISAWMTPIFDTARELQQRIE